MSVIITDANVLIDYNNIDCLYILKLYSTNVYEVLVPTVIVDEVDGIDDESLANLGISIIEESVEQEHDAFEIKGKKGLSYADAVCFVLARDTEGFCLTGEKALLSYCEMNQVKSMRGLRPLIDLAKSGHIHSDEAVRIGGLICDSNYRLRGKKDEIIDRIKSELGM